MSPPAFKKLKTSPFPTCPMEIVEIILLKLPVKSLLRFRCVDKSWNSLISDPAFGRRHLRKINRHHLLLTFKDADPVKPLLRSHPLSSTCRAGVTLNPPLEDIIICDSVVGSCDGIICISAAEYGTFLLWNPTIRKFAESPPLKGIHIDDRATAWSCGFGYDHLTQTYKVVAVSFDGEKVPSGIMVHTVGTDYWRRIEGVEFPSAFCNDESGQFVNGKLNWLTYQDHRDPYIFSLDLGKESGQQLCLPDYIPAEGLMLGVLRGCLCLFAHNDDDMSCDIWAMKKYGDDSSWTKVFTFNPHQSGGGDPHYISGDDDEVLPLPSLSNLVVCNYGDSYEKLFKIIDIKNGQVFCLLEPFQELDADDCDEPKVYAESLISPCHLNNRI